MATTTSKRSKSKRGPAPRRSDNTATIGVAVSAVVFVVAVAGVLLLRGGSSSTPLGAGSAGARAAGGAALQPIGGTNSMGFPYVSTPGSATGTVAADGVEVEGANWDLGHVPLSVAVLPEWTLTNTGSAPVTLGQPQARIRQGCCPGPFTLSTRTLAPGESATLTFELAMHEGMDGYHDMGVFVPVSGGAGDTTLVLNVKGDFSN
ncbi:MAG: hypothetical protein ACM3OO_00540 [Planctomycetaceae bacterium]